MLGVSSSAGKRLVLVEMNMGGDAQFMAAAVDKAQFAAELVEVDGAPPFVAEEIPSETVLDSVLHPLEDAGREELLRVRIGYVGVLVAVELAVDGAIAELVAHRCEGQLEAGVEAFVETEVAAVAILIVRAFESLHAAEDRQFLPLWNSDADRAARFLVARADPIDVAVAITAFVRAAAAGLTQPSPQPQPQPGSQPQPPSPHVVPHSEQPPGQEQPPGA